MLVVDVVVGSSVVVGSAVVVVDVVVVVVVVVVIVVLAMSAPDGTGNLNVVPSWLR